MKVKLKNKTILFILVLCLISTIGVGINVVTLNFQNEGSGDTLTATTGGLSDNGIYDIPTNPTKYQKELYKELSNLLKDYTYTDTEQNRDMEKESELVESVVKNFVADFFTWTNKASNYSIGGVQFVFSDLYLIFQSTARDSFYADLDGYIAQYGRENLIQVKEIKTDVAYSSGYTHNSVTYDSYYVQATWSYEDCELDVEDWQSSSAFHVIYHPETRRWEIAQFWNLE